MKNNKFAKKLSRKDMRNVKGGVAVSATVFTIWDCGRVRPCHSANPVDDDCAAGAPSCINTWRGCSVPGDQCA